MVKLKGVALREVGAIARCIQTISDVTYRDFNLQRGQFVFLTRVCEHPGINQNELSNILKVDKTTTAKAVQKLVNEGYILRERAERDKRMWFLYPTDKAKAVYVQIIKQENSFFEVCFSGFDSGEIKGTLENLKRMRRNIEEIWSQLDIDK